MKLIALIGLIVGFLIGFNVSENFAYPKYVWPKERGGLMDLNQRLKEDKTQRLGLAVVTEKGMYGIQSIADDKYVLRAGFFERQQPSKTSVK